MDSQVSLEVVQCRQFDPVSGPFSMNNERKNETASVYSIGSQRNLVSVKSKKTFLKKRNQISSLLMIVLFILMASLFVAVLVLSILYSRIKPDMKLCDSEDCVRIAASLKESMDPSVDPCDDFYKYTCGRWPREHPIPDSSLTNSWFNERTDRVARMIRDLLRTNISDEDAPWSVQQTQILYTSCLDVESMDKLGLSPLFELLELLNLPSTPAAITKETRNYIDQMARVKRILGRDVLIGLDVLPDPRNGSKNVIFLDTPIMGSPFPSDKELEHRLQSIRLRMRKLDRTLDDIDEDLEVELLYMSNVIKEVISNGTLDSCTLENENTFPKESDVADLATQIYELSTVLYLLTNFNVNTSLTEENIKDEDYMFVDDLQRLTDEYVIEVNSSLTPKIIWRPFIELLFQDVVTLNLSGKDKVLVGNLEYLKDLALVVASRDEQDIETYIWWVVVDIVVPHSSENLRKVWLNYLHSLMNVEIGTSQSLYCAEAVNQLMGMAVSWLFVDKSFHKEKAPKVREMLEDIRASFATLVRKTDWMDKETKKVTLEKSDKMSLEIGHPEWLFEEGELDEYYEDINLSKTKYLDNMLQVVRSISLAKLECLHDNNLYNESFWVTDPTDVNAFHTFQVNQITIPAGILQFPFYELGLEALNYGAIGTVLGHELTHGFDNSGRQYDSNGNLRQWWTNETISEYTERTQCFIDHYNSYYEDEVDDYINGELTLGENIADNGGLREAVIAYERWKARHGEEPLLPGFTHLTHEQLLFLSFAHLWCEAYTASSLKWMLQDSHCPGHVRLRAVLKNSKEFSEAWKCPLGSNMNPIKKCRLW
ncbi:PREDICTED: neprilysin-1 [Polistes canadensis]|uniref:neprilysin-1 n=1 Tax=Polistes canadensis TaxID=91411 RepID=UPI000718F68F|nr:PREDICTED: neprilysin-1 [Polistes canadensis]